THKSNSARLAMVYQSTNGKSSPYGANRPATGNRPAATGPPAAATGDRPDSVRHEHGHDDPRESRTEPVGRVASGHHVPHRLDVRHHHLCRRGRGPVVVATATTASRNRHGSQR